MAATPSFTGQLVRAVSIKDATYSDDGETAVVVMTDTEEKWLVGVIKLATCKFVGTVYELGHKATCVTRLALAPSGCCFVVGFDDGNLRVIRQDQTSKALVAAVAPPPPKRHTNIVNSVAVSSTGRVLASASDDRTVCLWDVDAATGASTPSALGGGGTLQHQFYVNAVAWSPTEEHLLATACFDGHVRLFDVRTGAVMATMAEVGNVSLCYNPVLCLAFDPSDGATTLAAGYLDA
jgi:WD40 repeat protein